VRGREVCERTSRYHTNVRRVRSLEHPRLDTRCSTPPHLPLWSSRNAGAEKRAACRDGRPFWSSNRCARLPHHIAMCTTWLHRIGNDFHRTRAPTRTHMRTHMHAHMHTYTHAHTHTHPHTRVQRGVTNLGCKRCRLAWEGTDEPIPEQATTVRDWCPSLDE
jgi:hypothetical protein